MIKTHNQTKANKDEKQLIEKMKYIQKSCKKLPIYL